MNLDSLAGDRLSAVEFVHEYVQLRFEEALLTLYVWPEIADAEGISVGYGQPNYRDALCSTIDEAVSSAELAEGDALTIEFENGSVLALSLRDEDLDTPEVGSFTSADGDTTEF